MPTGGTDDDRLDLTRSVASFWLLALLGPLVAALVLRAFTDELSPVVSMVVIAAAMPAPLIAAMVVGRRRPRDVLRSQRRALENPVALIVAPVIGVVVWFAAALALTAVLGNVVGVDHVGRVAGDTNEVRANVADFLDTDAAESAEIPPVPLLMVLGLVGGAAAGLTVNGLVAFGEEFGWRGHLWEQLAPNGRLATIGGIGVLWGLWHAPMILIVGYNYPDHRIAGVASMVVFAVASSWPLDELRRLTGSAVGPAILHGAINGTAVTLLFLVGGDRLWAAPLGLVGAVAFMPVGAVVRLLRRQHGEEV